MTTTLNGMTRPSWASHVEDKPAPMPLLRVQAFVDTWEERPAGTDVLAGRRRRRAMARRPPASCRPARPIAPTTRSAPEKPGQTFGRAIRALLAQQRGAGRRRRPNRLRPLRDLARRRGGRGWASAPTGWSGLGPASRRRGLAAGLLGLLLIVRDAQVDGTWGRLKAVSQPPTANGRSMTARTAGGARGATWPSAATGTRTGTCERAERARPGNAPALRPRASRPRVRGRPGPAAPRHAPGRILSPPGRPASGTANPARLVQPHDTAGGDQAVV